MYAEIVEDDIRNYEGKGFQINERYSFTLNFVDDHLVLAQDAYGLEFIIHRL